MEQASHSADVEAKYRDEGDVEESTAEWSRTKVGSGIFMLWANGVGQRALQDKTQSKPPQCRLMPARRGKRKLERVPRRRHGAGTRVDASPVAVHPSPSDRHPGFVPRADMAVHYRNTRPAVSQSSAAPHRPVVVEKWQTVPDAP